MKVLLVRPPAPNLFKFSRLIVSEPLELEYLQTTLKKLGHEIWIYDGVCEKTSFEKTLKHINPDLVAITGYITQENLMRDYAQMVKTFRANIWTVVGGVHVQLSPERFYTDAIDFIYRSESMDDFAALVVELLEKEMCFDTVNGLIYKKSGAWVQNALTQADINMLPIPDRTHFYENQNRYHYLELEKVSTIKTAFSCPHNCNFCYCTQLGSGIYRTRVLSLVLEELGGLKSDNVMIADDDFLADISRTWAFVNAVKALGIQKTYICYARADAVAANPELIVAMKAIGFRYFIVGLEAITDADLVDYNKKTTEAINRACVENIHKAEAQIIALMMISHKATERDFKNLFAWAKSNKLIYTTVSVFTPLPGTPIYDDYVNEITTTQVEKYDFLHLVLKPENMSKFKFYRHYIKLTIKLFWLGKKAGAFDFLFKNDESF